jgi:hypothetical protein
MKLFVLLLLATSLLNACSSSKHWSGTSNAKGTQAEFAELNGKQSFTLLVPNDDTYLKYRFAVEGGELETTIRSPTERVLQKKLVAMVTDSIHLVNQKGSAYKVDLNGRQASGSFDVRFTSNTN